MERKPGRPRALTVDVIAQAALDDGVDVFSMPSVARRLGVAHSGLYRYVADRDGLLVEALSRAYSATTWPEPDLPWDDLLREIGETIWRACDQFPGLDRATQHARKPSPVVLGHMDGYVSSLHAQHFLLEDAAVAVEFAISLALDSSSQMRRLRQMMEVHDDHADIPVLKAFDTDEVWDGRGLYERKRDIFLTGLATRRIQTGA